MIKAELRANGQVIREIDLPESISEIPLSKWVDYLIASRKISEGEGGEIPLQTAQLETMCECVQIITGVSLEDLLSVDMYDCLAHLYAHIESVISRTGLEIEKNESGEAFFVHKGKTWTFPAFRIDAITKGVALPTLSVIQVVEVLEIDRMRNANIKANADPTGELYREIVGPANNSPEDAGKAQRIADAQKLYDSEVVKRGDADGSLLYTGMLRTIAVLATDGTKMPINDSEREIYIREKTVELSDIDAATALRVDFFLSGILSTYGATLTPVGTLSRLLIGLSLGIRLRTADLFRPRKKKMKRPLK